MIGPYGAVRPACANNPELFDMSPPAVTYEQVLEAEAACLACPLRTWCRQEIDLAIDHGEFVGDHQMQAAQVWANLRGEDGRKRVKGYRAFQYIRAHHLKPDPSITPAAAIEQPKKPRKKRTTKPKYRCSHGHKWPENPVRDTAGRKICDPCKQERHKRRHPCGTPAAAIRHYRAGEQPCKPCRKASVQEALAKRAQQRGEAAA